MSIANYRLLNALFINIFITQ